MDNAESTIVGESILITGNLNGDEDLTILGRVEGSISLTRTLTVAESGIVKAEVAVRNAVISGVVVGNITASDSIQVTESGRLVGDLRAPRVIITAGARVRGQVDMGDLEAPRASGPLPIRASSGTGIAKSFTGTTRPASALPARRATPAAPVAAPAAKAAAAKPAAAAATPARATAPVTSKKIKKKVVVKKRG